MSGTIAAVLPWGRLGAGMTGGVVFGVVSPAPKRIWLFGQSSGQLRQALGVITSSSSAPMGQIGGNNSSQPGSTRTSSTLNKLGGNGVPWNKGLPG